MVIHFFLGVVRAIRALWAWIGLRWVILVFVLFICGVLLAFNFILRPKMIASFFAGQLAPAVVVSAAEVKPLTWTPEIDAIGTAYASRALTSRRKPPAT